MRLRIIGTFIVLLSFVSLRTVAAIENEELIRASMLEKIAHFIEWPALTGEQFNICAFGNTSLLPALESYYLNSQFDKKSIKLISRNHSNAVLDCQIIYLDTTETRHLENILNITKDHPILVISEKKDSVSQGAHVDFFIEDSRLHLEVNRTALQKNHLSASYHLLRVARIVD